MRAQEKAEIGDETGGKSWINESEMRRKERKNERRKTHEKATEWQKSIPFGGHKIRAVECKCYIMNSQRAMTAIQAIILPWMCNEKYPHPSRPRRFPHDWSCWQVRTAAHSVVFGREQ